MKILKRIFLTVATGILLLLLIIFTFILLNSPGKIRPFLDKDGKAVPGSIAEIRSVNINGLEQRMIIRGRDTTQPVLLYLHGGPGSPEFPFVRQFNSGIEDLFVVCYWDQRGSCLSYSADIPGSSMTLSQFINDAAGVSKYLIQRFKRDKIYLLGHSWGSMLGAFTASKYPEYYYALISVGQVSDQQRSEEISYKFVLSKASELNDKRALTALHKIGAPPWTAGPDAMKKIMTERKYVTKYGGAVKKGRFYPNAIKAMYHCREYTLRDKINYFKGINFTLKYFGGVIEKSNLFKDIPSQSIPVYIMQGTSDYQTSFAIAKEYFDTLRAPDKEFFPFDNSAHSPIFEEPEKFEFILKEILLEQKNN